MLTRRPLPTALTRPSAEGVAVLRAGAGLAMLARPTLLPRLLGADSATAARVSWITQMLGAREVALGAGSLVALRRGRAQLWLSAGAATDSLDALLVGAAVVRGRVSRVTGAAVVLTAAAAAASQLSALRDPLDPV